MEPVSFICAGSFIEQSLKILSVRGREYQVPDRCAWRSSVYSSEVTLRTIKTSDVIRCLYEINCTVNEYCAHTNCYHHHQYHFRVWSISCSGISLQTLTRPIQSSSFIHTTMYIPVSVQGWFAEDVLAIRFFIPFLSILLKILLISFCLILHLIHPLLYIP